VTLIAIRSHHHDDVPPPTLTLDTTLLFSIEQFVLGIFPAIDPIRSTSVFNTADGAEAVRRQLRASEAIRSWFAQPLFIAENHTGDPGTWIEPIDAESELARLIQ
jgi:F0F1-type ATP synthase beta subunit